MDRVFATLGAVSAFVAGWASLALGIWRR